VHFSLRDEVATGFKWKTAFRALVAEYDRDMTSAHTDSDLLRLRQFLKTLEAEARVAVGGIDPNTREIEILKREIAHLERVQQEGSDDRSKEILLRIAIDYAASRQAA
jgi:ribosomal protein L29